jgi:hypothetical protein
MWCKDKDSLAETYERALQAYSNAVLRMRHNGALVPLEKFEVLYEEATHANSLYQGAAQALWRHVAKHDC